MTGKYMVITHEAIVWESLVERQSIFQELDVLRTQPNVQRFDIVMQVLYLPTAHNWEDVWGLLHEICDGN